jgi:hypothetical protein
MVRMLSVVGMVLALSVQAEEAPKAELKNAVTMQLTGGAALMGPLGAPGAVGLEYEHVFGQVALALGASVTGSGVISDAFGFGGFGVALEPGLRLHIVNGRGLWFGVSVPLGWSGYSDVTFSDSNWTAGAAATLGFKHVFESGLVLQINAGPEGTYTARRVVVAQGLGAVGGSTRSLAMRIRTGVGVGWAF